jgi:hypothetical protein
MMKKITFLVFFICLTNVVFAGDCLNCTIKSLGVGPHYDGICGKECVFISLNGSLQERPSCATDTDWHFVLDTSTDSGKQTYSLLLMAYAANKNINLGGLNNCALYGQAESFRYTYFQF